MERRERLRLGDWRSGSCLPREWAGDQQSEEQTRGARAAAQPGGQADRLWSLARAPQSLITSLGRLDGVVTSIPCLSPLNTRY